ncbi:hypothetical protein LIER_12177 [Lithospermum erythrorhizon]|uniref:Ubiquitin-like protease family profile domain-containing protein n=1 Tax=Lithospermum erythrorhizon TaxID=34254 RepID=A0AAV3PSH0_LITER
MPQQKDGSSCGALVMKYMEECYDNVVEMSSFRNWNRSDKAIQKTQEFRINICYGIINDASNIFGEPVGNLASDLNLQRISIIQKELFKAAK